MATHHALAQTLNPLLRLQREILRYSLPAAYSRMKLWGSFLPNHATDGAFQSIFRDLLPLRSLRHDTVTPCDL